MLLLTLDSSIRPNISDKFTCRNLKKIVLFKDIFGPISSLFIVFMFEPCVFVVRGLRNRQIIRKSTMCSSDLIFSR